MRSICFWMLKHVWIDVCPSCKGNEYWYLCPTHTVAGKEWAGEHKKQEAGGCYECAIGQQELSHSQAPISVSYRSPSCLVLGSKPDGPFAVSQHVVWDLWARCLKRVCEIQMSAFSSRSQSRSGVSSSFLPICIGTPPIKVVQAAYYDSHHLLSSLNAWPGCDHYGQLRHGVQWLHASTQGGHI